MTLVPSGFTGTISVNRHYIGQPALVNRHYIGQPALLNRHYMGQPAPLNRHYIGQPALFNRHYIGQPALLNRHHIGQPALLNRHCIGQPALPNRHCIGQPALLNRHCIGQPALLNRHYRGTPTALTLKSKRSLCFGAEWYIKRGIYYGCELCADDACCVWLFMSPRSVVDFRRNVDVASCGTLCMHANRERRLEPVSNDSNQGSDPHLALATTRFTPVAVFFVAVYQRRTSVDGIEEKIRGKNSRTPILGFKQVAEDRDPGVSLRAF